MITKRKLNCRVKNTTYSFHLHTTAPTTHCICVRIDNAKRYCPLQSGTKYLNVRISNAVYHAVDSTPVAQVVYNVVDSPSGYQARYLYKSFRINNTITINNVINVQLKIGTTWTTILSLPKQGTSSSLTSNTRKASYKCRLQVGGWTSSEFNVLGNSSKSISIPEAYWGV